MDDLLENGYTGFVPRGMVILIDWEQDYHRPGRRGQVWFSINIVKLSGRLVR